MGHPVIRNLVYLGKITTEILIPQNSRREQFDVKQPSPVATTLFDKRCSASTRMLILATSWCI